MPNADRAGRPVLASISIRASFQIDELRLGKLSETVVVVGTGTVHDRMPLLARFEISVKIPLRNFLVSANIPTGLCCGGLF